ncbi:hypothetical protein P879_02167 [Paragonimus westermani]|uniref:G-protein coupled receptors family 1 profile domain-containing protein n=1 Tax=Paragonimus westermani TaxID=34504 RepID=A0A8T0DWS0_9TREM|nr:hypothetical protein P879_02167 [Paragonimus westermani]
MSLDRFLAVVYPIQCVHIRTQSNSVKAVLCVWIVLLLANLPLFMLSRVVQGSAEGSNSSCVTNYCTYKYLVVEVENSNLVTDNKEFGKVFFTLFFLFGYLIPLVIICALYIGLIYRLRCRKIVQLKQSAESRRSQKRVTTLVITVVIIFGLSWLPLHVVFLFQYYSEDPNTTLFRVIQIVCNCLAYGNSCVNPIFYAFLSINFRKAFIDLLHGRRQPVGTIPTKLVTIINNRNTIQDCDNLLQKTTDQQKSSNTVLPVQELTLCDHVYDGNVNIVDQ